MQRYVHQRKLRLGVKFDSQDRISVQDLPLQRATLGL